MADFNAQDIVPSLEAGGGTAGAIPAELIVGDVSPIRGTAADIGAQQLFGADGPTTYFKMRGRILGAYVTWVVTGAPDPDGNLATVGNTTPPLSGSIVVGSGIVVSKWTG